MKRLRRYYLHILHSESEALKALNYRKRALTFSLGAVLSLFPLLGATAVLNLTAGVLFRLNHSIMQGLNLVLMPLQLLLMYPFYSLGRTLIFPGNENVVSVSFVELVQADLQDGILVLMKAFAGGVLIWTIFGLLVGTLIHHSLLLLQRKVLS